MTPNWSGNGLSQATSGRRPRATAFAAFGLVFVLIAGLVAAGVWLRHDEVIRDARRTAEDLAELLSKDLEIQIASMEEALLEIAAFSRFIGGPTASGQEWMTLLRTTVAGRNGVEALMVTDADGRISFSSLPILMGESRRDGRAFEVLSQNPRNDTLIADDPERSSNDSKIVLPLSRVIRTPNAEFQGMAVANLAPEQLRELYSAADVGENGVVWLLQPPDSVLLREPPSDRPSDEAWPAALADAIDAGQAGVVTGPIASGAPRFTTAYRALDGTGLTVAVSLAEADILAPWWTEVYAAAAVIVLVGMILLVAAVFVARGSDVARSTAGRP